MIKAVIVVAQQVIKTFPNYNYIHSGWQDFDKVDIRWSVKIKTVIPLIFPSFPDTGA
jgi:hypothetical protein